MKSKKTKQLTFMAMSLSIELILVFTPLGYIPLGPLSLTTMHIPVILAAILLGKGAGAQLGFVFGLSSLIRATLQPTPTSFCFSPLISGDWRSALVALVPRILLGYFAGAVFVFFKERCQKPYTATILAALVGSLTNTLLVLGGIYLFFGAAYASAIQITHQALLGVLMGVIGTNGLIEAALAAILALGVYKAFNPK